MDNGNLLEEFDRQPKERWPMLAQQAKFQTPAVVTALLRRAIAHRRTDHAVARAAAEASATLTQAMPGEPALRAWSLAELANSRRAGEAFESAADLVRRAEAVLPEEAPAEVRGHVVLVKSFVLRDLLEFDAAALAAEGAISWFHEGGCPYDQAVAMATLGVCLTYARRIEEAKTTFDEARRFLFGTPALGEQIQAGIVGHDDYYALVGLVQLNGFGVWVWQAELEEDPEERRELADMALGAIQDVRRIGSEFLPERERVHFDWLEARAMICAGLYGSAIPKLERVRAHFENEGRFVQAAVVGNDLLFAHAARGDLAAANEEARQMLATYREHDLPKAQVKVLEQMSEIRRRYAALRLLRGSARVQAAAPGRAKAIV